MKVRITIFAVLDLIFAGTALLEWVLSKQDLLLEATQSITKSVLLDHVRLGSYAEEGQFSCKMIEDLIDRLKIAVNKPDLQPILSPEPPTKRMRGRPRKKVPLNPPDDDQGRDRVTRQSKRVAGSGLSELLAGPSFTLSPTKLGQKVEKRSLLTHILPDSE
jgi:hypothetical protein